MSCLKPLKIMQLAYDMTLKAKIQLSFHKYIFVTITNALKNIYIFRFFRNFADKKNDFLSFLYLFIRTFALRISKRILQPTRLCCSKATN